MTRLAHLAGPEPGIRPACHLGPLLQALTAVPRPRWQQLKQLVEPFWLSLVANLIPGLSETLRLPAPPGLEDTHKQLPQAIARMLLDLQEIVPPQIT
jgi:hypothetical protein